MAETSRFSSPLATLLTMAGVAVGLGNVWRFPYMMGDNGGSAFLLIYLVLMILFAVPVLCAEWALGRHTRSDAVGAYRIANGPRLGLLLGGVLVFGIAVTDSYYMVVIGQILYTAIFAASEGFDGDGIDHYRQGLNNGWLQYGFALIVLVAGIAVVHRGLRRGIEAASTWFVPFFGLVMLSLVGYAMSLDGAWDRMLAFLRPDFSRIGIQEVFAAMGQAAFSLAIGGTFMVIYGSFLRPDQSIPRTALLTAFSDTAAAFLATAFIVPAVLVFNLNLAEGPQLMFTTLPQLFATMPGGRVVAVLFVTALTLMAFLSAVAALEVCLGGLLNVKRFNLSRGQWLSLLALFEAVIMLPPALYPSVIAKLDLIFGSGMLVFGAAVAVISLGWRFGKTVLTEQIGIRSPLFVIWMRWAVPAALLTILGLYIYDNLIAA